MPTKKSHISHAVCDSKLEQQITHQLEQNPHVEAYAKNDRLFLEIPYRYFGKSFRYRPDFLVRLDTGATLLIEGKGKPDEKDDAKKTAAARWITAVNSWCRLGTWDFALCFKEAEVGAIIEEARGKAPTPVG